MKRVRLAIWGTVLSFLTLAAVPGQAQESPSYSQAIGGRFGVANGITYKHFLNESHAIDGIVNFQGNRSFALFKLLALYEIHLPIYVVDVEGLQWYYGFGGGIGSYRYKNIGDSRYDERGLAWSFDGVVGLDYKLPTAPLNFSIDWKPTLELTPESGLRFDGIGLSIRYVIR